MLCASPISVRTGGRHETMLVGCGQCLPCRVNRRRIWVHRLMLEAALHGDKSFVTLTYSDENLPVGGTLVPADLRNFLKRLRKSVEPARLRFFAAGEYGDTTERPHYHLALFGYPNCSWGQTRPREHCCAACDQIRESWGHGNVFLGELTDASASYIAGYVLKKMTGKDDLRLAGRHPEFARMSNRPGIGADMMHEVASTLLDFNLDETQADVPSALRHGTRTMALGRYLHRKLRTYVGKSPDSPESVKAENRAEMQRLREAQSLSKKQSLSNVYVEENLQKIRNLEGKQLIRPKKGSL